MNWNTEKKTYEDFKYVMMDTAYLYLGSKYSYGEVIENEDILFKFRSIIERYILPEMDPETTLESHFYYMDTKEFAYKTYRQLKIKIKISKMVEKKPFLGIGKVKHHFVTEMIPLDKFVAMPKEEKERNNIMVQEIVINKLALMSFMV